jgi:hypothetical protein
MPQSKLSTNTPTRTTAGTGQRQFGNYFLRVSGTTSEYPSKPTGTAYSTNYGSQTLAKRTSVNSSSTSKARSGFEIAATLPCGDEQSDSCLEPLNDILLYDFQFLSVYMLRLRLSVSSYPRGGWSSHRYTIAEPPVVGSPTTR